MTARPWDVGIRWRTETVSIDRTFRAVPLRYVADLALRVGTGQTEDDLISTLIAAATALCERETGSLITPARHRMWLSGFPCGRIVFPEGPVRDVVSVTYLDGDGVEQTYGGSPPSWKLIPAGRYQHAELQAASTDAWPSSVSTSSIVPRLDAVKVEYLVGYTKSDDVPHTLRQGIALAVAELYKNPDLSNADGQIANTLALSRFWPRTW